MRHLPITLAVLLGLAAAGGLIYLLNAESKDVSGPKQNTTSPQADAEELGPKQVSLPVEPADSGSKGSERSDGLLTDGPVPKPLHIRSKLPPLTTVSVTNVPEVDHGIRMPDGSFLPLLNGMTQAPAVNRNKTFGEPGPIVAKTVDSAGFEWWVHADGSTTTSKYKEVVLQDGTRYWDPATFHNAPMPKDSLVNINKNGDPVDPAGKPKK